MIGLGLIALIAVGPGDPGASVSGSDAAGVLPVKLVHESTVELPQGTHRPEVLVTDSGELVVAVVQPMGPPGEGQVKHRAYRFDASLKQIGEPFNLTWVEAPWGEPADHRVAMHGDELVVVYQALNFADRGAGRGGDRGGGRGKGRGGGPAEDLAIDQSLLLARFDLEGNEMFRGPIVELATNFYRDNFPDHCLLLEGDRLLVSTGTRGGGPLSPMKPTVAIREVDLEGVVEAEHRFPEDSDNIQGTIGNSMIRLDEGLVMVSGRPMPGEGLNLSVITDGDPWTAKLLATLPGETERHFPTDVLQVGDTVLVGYISRERGGGDPHENPYHPRLLLVGADRKELADLQVGEGGFAHVHPTMAVAGDRLFFCWSRRLPNGSHWMPQVVIEIFRIDHGGE